MSPMLATVGGGKEAVAAASKHLEELLLYPLLLGSKENLDLMSLFSQLAWWLLSLLLPSFLDSLLLSLSS